MSVNTTTTPTTTVNNNNPPDTSSCVIQPTMDEQLNYNLGELVAMIIGAFQDGTVSTKNSERLQNLTVDDIIDIVIKKLPSTNLTSYITQNGTTIVEMIDSYNIIKDTKFVNSDFLEFQVITRREDDPTDPTGITKIEVPYIRAKLPYDLINRDRIVQVYLTTKNDENDNLITNDVLFEYKLDTDPTDIRAPYVIEARAQKINVGKTKEFDIYTHPTRSDIWGTWSDEKYIVVSYLVDYGNWYSDPIDPNPDPSLNYVSKVTSSSVIPMTWGGTGVTTNTPEIQKPNESVDVEFEATRVIQQESFEVQAPENVLINQNVAIPNWIIIEDPANAKQFDDYINWFAEASKIIRQQEDKFTWKPNPANLDQIELINILIMPSNKIISQETFDLVANSFVKFGSDIGLEGLASKIIEMTLSRTIEIKAISQLEAYGTIRPDDNRFSLLAKLNDGEQYPFLSYEPLYLPNWIINQLSGKFNGDSSALLRYFPARIIEQVRSYLTKFSIDIGYMYLTIPTRIINFLASTDIRLPENVDYIKSPSWIIEEDQAQPFEDEEFDKLNVTDSIGAKIILEDDPEVDTTYETAPNTEIITIPAWVINQNLNLINPAEDIFTQWKKDHTVIYLNEELKVDYTKCIIYEPSWIVNQQGFYPAKMEVHSGTLAYIQDKYNMHIISSLNKEEFVPLITAEGKQQRSEYEFTAAQDQRVFNVQHNPDMVTVYRQGFKLSYGDFYSNGSKIILKSPANAGEIINIVSERRYVFSNGVTKEELNNALEQMKTERPILTYPATAFEKSSAEIKIENYDSTLHYSIQIKYEGRLRDDVTWVKQHNKIIIDIPEVTIVSRKTLSVVVYAGMSGRLQSTPTEAIIMVKNLFDTVNGNETHKIVIGTVPTVWFGKQNTNYTFEEVKSPKSEFTELTELTTPFPIGKRIALAKNKYYQSSVLNTGAFVGSFVDSAIGLENLPARSLKIMQTNGSETVFSTKKTPEQLQEAFEKGNLYFIVDSSTTPDTNNYRVPNTSGYDGNTYSYRPALEFTSKLNILPRTDATEIMDATWYLEHNNSLRGRYIRAALILDINFLLDFDFDEQAVIDEETEITKRKQLMESIRYQVQDSVPHLLITINDPEIPNITNPYINIGSKFEIPTNNERINALQQEETLLVNNLYAERIFSGLHVDTSVKDNFPDTLAIYNRSKKYKKFIPYTPTALMGFDTYYKKDFFMLNEDDVNLDPTKSIVSMARFFNDKNLITDNPSYSIRVKELQELVAIPESFRGIYSIPNEPLSVGSGYTANLAHIQYGGSQDYIDDLGQTRKLIEQKLTYCKLFIQDTANPQDLKSGQNPNDFVNSVDGFHVLTSTPRTIRIPTWWDVVLRPSVRPNRTSSLNDIFQLIKNRVNIDDQRWLKITDGILKRPYVVNHNELFGAIRKNHDVVSIPDRSHLFLFGGIGYKPTQVKRINGLHVSAEYLGNLSIDPTDPNHSWYLNNLKYAYNKRGTNQLDSNGNPIGGWKGKTDIIAINYGWENGEPYVDYAWAQHYTYRDTYNYVRDGIKFYIDRISRVQRVNKDIYHLDLAKLDNYSPNDNDLYPLFITKITNVDYRDIYKSGPNEESLVTPISDKVEFQDVTYDAPTGTWWITLKPAFSRDTMLYKFNINYTSHTSGTGIVLTAFTWKQIDNLQRSPYLLNEPQDTNLTKWSLLPDITSTLRGDGPILIKHDELIPYGSGQSKTKNPGIYYYDTWHNEIHLEKLEQDPLDPNKNIVPTTSTFFGVPEITGVRNPYIIQLDPQVGIQHRIDIVGSRIFVVVYLDKFISKMDLETFNLFKEEILHIENNISTANPDKNILILPNIIPVGIRTILPDGDDYKATSAQILLNRVSTQTGRPANNLVFRLTNKDSQILEVENIRFQTL